MPYTTADFGRTVREDYERRLGSFVKASADQFDTMPATRAELGHPLFGDMSVGQLRSAEIACVFLDLSDFTGRTFWDGAYETALLAHAVSSGFIEVVMAMGGHPIGLRGDGLFAAFGPGVREVDIAAALASCALALQGVQDEVNPWLARMGKEPVQARAGADYGEVTFVRSGSSGANEVNQIGFAANFAAKCEKYANAWEVVVGSNLADRVPNKKLLKVRDRKRYTRAGETRSYWYYDYAWRGVLPLLPTLSREIDGNPTTKIRIG